MNSNFVKRLVSFDDESNETDTLLNVLVKQYGWRVSRRINGLSEVTTDSPEMDAAVALHDLYWQSEYGSDPWKGFKHIRDLQGANLYPAKVVYSNFSSSFEAVRSIIDGALDFLPKALSDKNAEAVGFSNCFEWYNHRLEVALMRQMLRYKRHTLFLRERQDSFNILLNDIADWFCLDFKDVANVSVVLPQSDGKLYPFLVKDFSDSLNIDRQWDFSFLVGHQQSGIELHSESGFNRIVSPLFFNSHESNVRLGMAGFLVIECAVTASLSDWTRCVLRESSELIVDLLLTSPDNSRFRIGRPIVS